MKEIKNKELYKMIKQKLDALERLQKENNALEKQLEALNSKLEEAETFKSHFISNVTNEIVNPFSSVMGLAKTIVQMKGNQLKKAPSLAGLIYSEAAFLDFQLANIFAAAKIESGEIAIEASNVNIQELMESAVKKLQHEMDKKKLALHMEVEMKEGVEKLFYFKTDREKLQLILVNLLSNAIKASGEGKAIRMTARFETEKLMVELSDEGDGINEEDKEKIFDRFHRIDATINSLNPGNGLGLSVVKGLLDILEGTIAIDSEIGKGTTLTITLPETSNEEGVFDDDVFTDMDDETF